MNRAKLVRRLGELATQPVDGRAVMATLVPAQRPRTQGADLFVWFEDTSGQSQRAGIAGLPESLLPVHPDMRVLEQRYVFGHLHLLAGVRFACRHPFGERIAALYTAALSVGTVAWIGTGPQYERAWSDTYHS